MSSEFLFKTLLVGESESLKDTLFTMVSPTTFLASYKDTIGVHFGVGKIPVQREQEYVAKLQLWVLHSGSRFANCIPSFVKGASGCVIIVDVNQRQQLERALSYWLPIIEENAGSATKLVVGCVEDPSRRQFEATEVQSLVPHHVVHYYEVRTSIRDDTIRVFRFLADLMLEGALQEYNPARDLDPLKQVLVAQGYHAETDIITRRKPRYTFQVNLRTGRVFVSPTTCSCAGKCQYTTRLCIIPESQFKGWSNIPGLSKQDVSIIAKLLALDNEMVPSEVMLQISSAEEKWRDCRKAC